MDALFSEYRQVVALVEQEFDRHLALYRERIQCGKGCFSCCSQMFRITLMDAVMISRAIREMTPERRAGLQESARAYLKRREELIGQRAVLTGQFDMDEIPTTGLRLFCPALEDGACGLYEARPVVCRKWGIPLYDPNRPDNLQACELNFPAGTAFEDEELDRIIERQTEISERWQRLKARVNDRVHPEKMGYTIAEAILYDFDAMIDRGLSRPEPFYKTER
jgi:Fe-S-cluster containining protein